MILRSVKRLVRWTFFPQRKLVFSAPLSEVRDTEAKIPVEFRFATEADLLSLDGEEYGYSDDARAFGLERMKAGDRMVLGIHQGKVVYFGWLMFNQMDLRMRDFYSVSGRSVYAYKLFTHSGFRGKQICPAFYTFLKRHFSPLGFERVLCWVASTNAASIKTHLNAGLKRTGAYWHLRLLGRDKFMLDDDMKAMGIRRFFSPAGLARAAKETA